jgi:hypothetical protein
MPHPLFDSLDNQQHLCSSPPDPTIVAPSAPQFSLGSAGQSHAPSFDQVISRLKLLGQLGQLESARYLLWASCQTSLISYRQSPERLNCQARRISGMSGSLVHGKSNNIKGSISWEMS